MLIQIRKHLKNKKAQSTAEYAVLLGLVIGAVVTMQVYVKRSLQAKIRNASDLITQQTGYVNGHQLETTEQYEPYYLSREQRQTLDRDKTEKTVDVGGEATSTTGKTLTQDSIVRYRAYEKPKSTP